MHARYLATAPGGRPRDMTHHRFQTQFSEALVAPLAPNPSKRFAVYRNNVFVGLVEALRARFPAIENAVGTEFFIALARDYASRHQPRSPVMTEYGADFPDFIKACDALRDYPWLHDVARLEMKLTEIYHARDQNPIGASAFAGLTPEALATLRITFIDACAILNSEFPIVTLWQMNSGQIEPAPINDFEPQSALISREDYDVAVQALSHHDAVFLDNLSAGQSLSDAILAAQSLNADFDPQNALSIIISKGLVVSLNSTSPEIAKS